MVESDLDARPDPNVWYRAPSWNFAHRLDIAGANTLCRRSVPDLPPVAGDDAERCPICSSILGKGAL